jgi:hypothetical protein
LAAANAQNKKVDIVEETELDMLPCSASGAACLKRAKQWGKGARSSTDDLSKVFLELPPCPPRKPGDLLTKPPFRSILHQFSFTRELT